MTDPTGSALLARIKELEEAIKYVVVKFENDEAQGYRSRDRQFAIDILRLHVPNDQ